tara:strand:- start:1371 stop:1961 length:591 start_codon:yes stop_codon:yes gene_type:complete
MALTLNGSNNTIAGVAVGGLPDGIVDNDMIANTTIAEGKLAANVNTITEADQWRVTSNFSSSADPITSNWERNDTSFDKVGTGMSESSGVFTFPSTGIWRLDYQAVFYSTANSSYSAAYVKATTNNSAYSRIAYTYTSIYVPSGTWYKGVYGTVMFDVTNVSTHKVSLEVGMADGNCMAGTEVQNTGLTFIRLGDT